LSSAPICARVRCRRKKLVKGNNRVGFALAWPDYLGGHPSVRCFMPGTSGYQPLGLLALCWRTQSYLRGADTASASLVELHAGALVVGADPFSSSRREQLVALASRSAVPSIYAWREFAASGGLISYGASLTSAFSPGRPLGRRSPQGRQSRQSAGRDNLLNSSW
jgi:hypothetical protein